MYNTIFSRWNFFLFCGWLCAILNFTKSILISAIIASIMLLRNSSSFPRDKKKVPLRFRFDLMKSSENNFTCKLKVDICYWWWLSSLVFLFLFRFKFLAPWVVWEDASGPGNVTATILDYTLSWPELIFLAFRKL